MPLKSKRWCARCKSVHADKCPNVPVWEKPVHKKTGRGGRPWQRKRERIFIRDEFLCQICLRLGKLTVVTLHGLLGGVCDHIVALERGGSDDDSNLQTICKACDKIKTQNESRLAK